MQQEFGNIPGHLDGMTLYVVTMVIFVVTLPGLWTMWYCRDTIPRSRLVITQRRRYTWSLAGQTAASAAVLWPILQFGAPSTFMALDAWRQLPPIGWVVYGAYWLGIVSPGLTVLVMISIYRHPAQAARRVRGGYVLTEHARQKLDDPPVVQPVVARGSSGLFRRFWFDRLD